MGQHITTLRKAGHIDEAYELAQQRLKESGNDVWVLRAYSWVLYELLKRALEQIQFDEFLRLQNELASLALGEDERMLWDNVAKLSLKYIWRLAKEGETEKLSMLIEGVSPIVWDAPSELYSSVSQAILKCIKHQDAKHFNSPQRFDLVLLEWIDSQLFIPEDYQPKSIEGKKQNIPSLVETYYNTYARVILKYQDKLRAAELLPRLQKVAQLHSSWIWCSYNAVKLLVLLGEDDKDMLRQQLHPVVKSQRNQFWVWGAYAELYDRGSDERFSCLSRAIRCPLHAPEMTIGLRRELIKELHHRACYNEARYEIDTIIRLCQEQNWRVKEEIIKCLSLGWYVAATAQNPEPLYLQHSEQADELVFGVISKPRVIITHINSGKKMASTLSVDKQSGFFSYAKLNHLSLEVGQAYELSLFEEPSKGKTEGIRYLVKSLKIIELSSVPNLVKNHMGAVRTIPSGAAFVGDIYISSELVKRHKLTDNLVISLTACLKRDSKKNSYGWFAIAIKVGN